jgi:acyl-CoA synthetase (AMP-forming)/AMP-acid ligase II
MFSAQVDQLRELFDIKEGEVSLATFPLFGLFDVALGQTVIIPDMDFTRPGLVDPMAIIVPAQKYRVHQLFGSPALLDRVGRFGAQHGIALPTLKRVMSAGAPVPAKTLALFSKLLNQNVPIYTPYGATEALPVALTSSFEILGETAARTLRGEGVCVGRPVKGIEAAVIRISDDQILAWSDDLRVPRGTVGEIVVKGPVVTGEYFRRVPDMAKAKLGDGKGFWHRMGDLGYYDETGRLWFCGRKAHRVRTEKGEHYTICVEGVFNAHPKVKRSALVGVGLNPVLCVELEPGTDPTEALKNEILNLPADRIHGTSRICCFIPASRSIPATTRRSTARRWPSGRAGGSRESARHRRGRLPRRGAGAQAARAGRRGARVRPRLLSRTRGDRHRLREGDIADTRP